MVVNNEEEGGKEEEEEEMGWRGILWSLSVENGDDVKWEEIALSRCAIIQQLLEPKYKTRKTITGLGLVFILRQRRTDSGFYGVLRLVLFSYGVLSGLSGVYRPGNSCMQALRN